MVKAARAGARLGGRATVKTNVIHIHAQRVKPGRYGRARPRYPWGQREWAQATIGMLRDEDRLVRGMSTADLLVMVRKHLLMRERRLPPDLRRDRRYRALIRYKTISRYTVLEAAELQGLQFERGKLVSW